jgi:hypothetical protein
MRPILISLLKLKCVSEISIYNFVLQQEFLG